MGVVLVWADWLDMKPFGMRVKDRVAGDNLITNTILDRFRIEYILEGSEVNLGDIAILDAGYGRFVMANKEVFEMKYVEDKDVPEFEDDYGWEDHPRPLTIYDGDGVVHLKFDDTYGVYDEV